MDVYSLEPILKANSHIIEEFSWITTEMSTMQDIPFNEAVISDFQEQTPLSVEIYGILPNLFDATVNDFVVSNEY